MAERRHDLGGGAHLRQRAGSKKGYWSVYAYIDGQEFERSTKTADVAEAEVIARRLLGEARKRVETGRAAKQATMLDVLARYRADHLDPTAPGLDDDERRRRTDMRRRLDDYWVPYFASLGRRTADGVSDEDVAGYVEWRQLQRKALIARMRAEHAQAVEEARRSWEGSTRLRRRHPDVAAYLPVFSLGQLEETVSPSTYNAEFSLLSHIFDQAIAWKFLDRRQKPLIVWRKPKGFRPKALIEDLDFDAVMDCALARYEEARASFEQGWQRRTGEAPPADAWTADRTAWGRYRLAVAVMLTACSGLRPSSLVRLRRKDVQVRRNGLTKKDAAEFWKAVEGDAKSQAAVMADDDKEPPYYIYIAATTRKGAQNTSDGERAREIVPEAECYPMVIEYLRHFQAPEAPLFDVAAKAFRDGYKNLLAVVGLNPKLTFHGLRHAYITRQGLKGKSVIDVAKNTLTSAQMIAKHYDRATPRMKAKELSR
jgi:integrase